MKTVLVTGASGMIGQLLLKRLADTYTVTGLDIRPSPGVAGVSVADYGALLPHLAGVNVVVHLGAVVSPAATWEEVLEHNIIGTRNVLEAARGQGVGRVILASSHQALRVYEDQEPYASVLAGGPRPPDFVPIGPQTPFRPSGFYGASKAFGEILGRVYADHYGLSVLCIRIVRVNAANRPHGPRWFSHNDVEQMVRRCIEAPPDLAYGVYFGVSDNAHAIWDTTNAERDLGYRPQDGLR